MEAVYRLNTKDLGIGFVNSLQAAYPDQSIEITVRSQVDDEMDETEYLNSTAANREHLARAMQNVAEGKLISFNTIEEVMQAVKERAAKR